MSPRLEVRSLPIEKLIPAPYNPRLILQPDDRRYQKLARSLREFGLVEPLIWNETTGHLVGGHARLAILKSMNVRQVPVSVVRLSVEREKALNVVLNNLEAQGRFDPDRLANVLEELADLPELELTGFDQRDLADLRLEPVDALPAEADLDRVEVTIVADAETYERFAAKLDGLIREFDLVCHVRKRN
jgi:ParB-like chromosome segregation protein Spo0J